MKKTIVTLALLAGTLTFAFANDEVKTEATAEAQSKTISMEELTPSVQSAIKSLASETVTIVSVEKCQEPGYVRVTIANKADNSQNIITLDKDGKEIKETK